MCHGNIHDHKAGKGVAIARQKKRRELNTTKHEGRDQTIGVEKPELEERYHEIIKNQEKADENAKAEAEEVEGTFTQLMVNDDVETTGEAGEAHPEFHTLNEEAGHIVLHVEHVEHDMDDDIGERTMTGREGTESTESKREDANGDRRYDRNRIS